LKLEFDAVPFAQLDKYKQAVPDSESLIFEDRGHFNLEKFPEIVKLIKNQ